MKFDAVIIGGGLAGTAVATALQENGLKCAVVAEGLSIHNAERQRFELLGGYLLRGDVAVNGTIKDGEVKGIGTRNMGPEALTADIWVIATGKFFGKGLVATMDGIYEPIFGLDVKYAEDRAAWFDPDFSKPQPFLDFGLETDEAGHPFKDGAPVRNLYAAGEILAGISSASPEACKAILGSAEKVIETIKKER